MSSIPNSRETAKKPAPAPDTPPERVIIDPEVIRAGDEAFGAMEDLLERPGSAPSDEPPASALRRILGGGNGGDGGDDDDGGGDDDEPPTSPSPTGPLSRLAVRLDDCVLLVSLEDAADRNLEGREIISFMVLSADEIALARLVITEPFFDAAAKILARLPRRKP